MKLAALGIVGLLLLALDRGHALTAYAAAYFAALGAALGALVWLQIAHVTRARWLLPVRRQLENAAGLVPLMGILFVPILLASGDLYPWGHASGDLGALVVDGRRPAWLHAVVAFGFWTVVAELLRRWSRQSDRAPSPALADRQRSLAAGALPFLGLVVTMFAYDFLMTLEGPFHSSIYGVLFFSGGAVSGLAVAVVSGVTNRATLPAELGRPHFFAQGKMLLAMVMFWTYIELSQLILIWIANLPSEVGWYEERIAGPWRPVAVAVPIVCFALPFLVLLSRRFKQRPERVAAIAIYLLVAHWLDAMWLVLPPVRPSGPALADIGAGLAMAGVFVLAMGLRGRGAAAYPLRDPDLASALAFEDA